MADSNDAAGRSGLAGTLKFLAILAVMAVGTLAILLILDVIPRDVFREAAVKGLGVIVIVAAVSGVIGLIIRSK